jgi:putative flavoprotein involved in K+ transport
LQAFEHERTSSVEAAMGGTRKAQRVHTVIVGGGQSGLSVAYFLKQRGIPFVILDANQRIGDAWRKRWDSLRLFTPAQFNGLAGMPFPAARHSFPTKDEMADYLEAYAAHFALPVRTGTRVDRLWKEGDRYMVSAGDLLLEAENVVVAMATYQAPRIPPFAAKLTPDITQLHSSSYTSVGQLRDGGVLVVGAGNSGAEIAADCARAGRTVWLAGRDVGHVPFRIEGRLARVVTPVLFRVVFHRLLTVDTPMGRRARMGVITKGALLIRQKPDDLRRAGVERVPRVSGERDGRPVLDDGRVIDASNVIWCTGFDAGLSWIDLPVLDERGEPKHERGLVPGEPGLSFVGQHFLYAMSSSMIHGVARDAERIVNAIVARTAPTIRRHRPAQNSSCASATIMPAGPRV